MFVRWGQHDNDLEALPFILDEVRYNLLHRITEIEDSLCMRSENGQLLFAQSPGHNGWLWMSRSLAGDEEKRLLQELVNHLEGRSLPGISGAPQTAYPFAVEYSRANNLRHSTQMTMEAYHCPEVYKLSKVKGEASVATMQDVDVVAHYLAGFSEDAYGRTVEPESQLEPARGLIESGKLYLWRVDGKAVSMANIAHRSPRHGRINAVFTPLRLRKKGYASAVVAAVSEQLLAENITPMLYADLRNPGANKVYRNIGFVPNGQIADIGFSPN
ncbi:GNAT family N-acetyltransferase [Paenibacillus lignilyticus]|uniref:GNAT family N-acetyltransferase n=1 Tax=Paenibacillus lignilyticus TaxID=1172615 RepID=A0ABS5CEI8_9BACL|nr:GNAT family N-acetyltransferase [Paenibacillus lignilyticus]MBP3963860.1 GNAT family N-acetyltransferase [Paenibacillus lignilyticus]